MCRLRFQSGFTLLEVVAAFVIFALTAAAVNEMLFGAVRRSARSADEIGAWLIAQSLRDERSAQPLPWPDSAEGESAGGWHWRILSKPIEETVNSELEAQDLIIEVSRFGSTRPAAILRSTEVARRLP